MYFTGEMTKRQPDGKDQVCERGYKEKINNLVFYRWWIGEEIMGLNFSN